MSGLLLQQLLNGLVQGMAYALVALGLTMVFGVLHVINFAHGEFYMLGGLTVVLATGWAGLPYGVGILAAIVAVGLVALIVDRVAVAPVLDRPDGASTVLLTTFAVGLLLQQSVLQSWGPAPAGLDGLPGSLTIGSVVIGSQRAMVLGVGAVLLVAVEVLLRRTVLGKRVRAVAQSAHAARVVGIDLTRVRSITFVGAGALAGLTGALLTPITLFSPAMGQHLIINAFVVVVIGGMGNASGAVVVGLALGVLESLTSIVMPQEVGSALIYSLLLATLLVRPRGLFGSARS